MYYRRYIRTRFRGGQRDYRTADILRNQINHDAVQYNNKSFLRIWPVWYARYNTFHALVFGFTFSPIQVRMPDEIALYHNYHHGR